MLAIRKIGNDISKIRDIVAAAYTIIGFGLFAFCLFVPLYRNCKELLELFLMKT